MSIAIPEDNPLALPAIPPTQTASALRWLRFCLTRNTVRSVLAGSRLRLSMILFCSLVFWLGLFGLFVGGFEFIGLSDELFNAIFEYLFSMFFLSILVMLFFSTGIITYTGLFHSREGAFLLSTPATTDRIFAYKFAEAVAMSSWGFFLLGSPLMVAYGLTVKAPIAFYGMFLVYLFMFVMIAGSMGAIAAILVANVFPRRQKLVLAGAGLGTLTLLTMLAVRIWNAPGATLTSDWLGSVQERLAFCQHPLWPSRWMSAGLLAAAHGTWSRAGYYLMVLSAHAGLGYLAAAAVARDLYFRGFNRVQGGRSSRRRLALDALDQLFHRSFFFLSRPVRLLILKDLRTFIRDPAQWSQFLIFFGLLAFYFLNIPRLGYGIQSPSWRNLISFLNLAVTALILSTFTSRFIFPLLSLEGRNFWVLGLFPLRREQILWGKFAFSVGISLADRTVGFLERPDARHARGDHRPAHWHGGGAVHGSFRNQCGTRCQAAQLARERPVQDRGRLRRNSQPTRQSRVHILPGDSPGRSLPPLFSRHRVPVFDAAGSLELRVSILVDRGDSSQSGNRRGRNDHPVADRDQGISEDGILNSFIVGCPLFDAGNGLQPYGTGREKLPRIVGPRSAMERAFALGGPAIILGRRHSGLAKETARAGRRIGSDRCVRPNRPDQSDVAAGLARHAREARLVFFVAVQNRSPVVCTTFPRT